LGASLPYHPLDGVGGGGGISFEVGSVSKVMLSYSQRARVAVAKIKLRMMIKTCAVPSEKKKGKGKLFMKKILPKTLTKNARRKNKEKPPAYSCKGKFLIFYS
jgi:hypothetical protein